MRVVSVGALSVLFTISGAMLRAQVPKQTPPAKSGAAKAPAVPLTDAEITKLVAQLEGDPGGPAMSSLGKAGMRGLRAAATQLTNPNPTVRGQVGFGVGLYGSGFAGNALPATERAWLAATLLRAAASERAAVARDGELSGALSLVRQHPLGAIPDTAAQQLREAARAWTERFGEGVSRGVPGTSSARHPDLQTLKDSRDVFDAFGSYLQQTGDVLLRALRDSSRATLEGDLALLSAASKGVGALPDTVVAAIVLELVDGRGTGWRRMGPFDDAQAAALKALPGAGRAGVDALVTLAAATSPRAEASALSGSVKSPKATSVPPTFGYARDNAGIDRTAELNGVIRSLGAACLAQPTERPRLVDALMSIALDSTYNPVPGARRNLSREVASHAAYEARIAAMEALPSCGPAARLAVDALTAIANRGDIGASEDEKALVVAAGKSIVAIKQSK